MKKSIETIYLPSLYEELGNSIDNTKKISASQKNSTELNPGSKTKEVSNESNLSDTMAPNAVHQNILAKDKSDQLDTSKEILKLDSFGFLNTLNETNSLNSARFMLLARRIIQLKQELTKDAEKLKVTGLGLNSL